MADRPGGIEAARLCSSAGFAKKLPRHPLVIERMINFARSQSKSVASPPKPDPEKHPLNPLYPPDPPYKKSVAPRQFPSIPERRRFVEGGRAKPRRDTRSKVVVGRHNPGRDTQREETMP
jgi:hypothetical protein